MRDCLYIVIPAYNEEETIQAVLKEWYKIVELHPGEGKSRLLVVNDGSRDHTEKILAAFAKEHPLFDYITQKNSGHGAAIWNGYQKALEMGADYIFQTDSDGQTTSADFYSFWARRKKADVITGQRVNRGDGRSRVLVSSVLGMLIRLIFRVSVEDANCPFRLMSRQTLSDAMRLVPEKYSLTNVILSVAFKKLQKNVMVLPVHFRKRQGGVNSINIRKITGIGIRSVWEFAKIERGMTRVKMASRSGGEL